MQIIALGQTQKGQHRGTDTEGQHSGTDTERTTQWHRYRKDNTVAQIQKGQHRGTDTERTTQWHRYRKDKTVAQIQKGQNSGTDTERTTQWHRYRKDKTVAQIQKGQHRGTDTERTTPWHLLDGRRQKRESEWHYPMNKMAHVFMIVLSVLHNRKMNLSLEFKNMKLQFEFIATSKRIDLNC